MFEPRYPVVEVTVHPETGDMSFNPSVLHARRGDRIRWVITNPNGDMVAFFRRTPFDEVEIRNVNGRESNQVPVRANAALGAYPYAVAVSLRTGDQSRVYVDPSCPQIIIEG